MPVDRRTPHMLSQQSRKPARKPNGRDRWFYATIVSPCNWRPPCSGAALSLCRVGTLSGNAGDGANRSPGRRTVLAAEPAFFLAYHLHDDLVLSGENKAVDQTILMLGWLRGAV
jgi:hypothetical protein